MALPKELPDSFKDSPVEEGQPRHGPERNDEPKSIATKWVTDSPGGHHEYINNDPPQKLDQHPSGTSVFVQQDGSKSTIVVGQQTDYVKGGWTMTCDQNGDITIGGHARISAAGGAYIEIKGDCDFLVMGAMNEVVAGSKTSTVMGDYSTHVGGAHNITAASVAHSATGGMDLKSGGGITATAGGDITTQSSQLTHNSKNVGHDHKHTEVMTGASLTGEPA